MLPSLQFCGKHVKIKNPRIWTEVNNVIPKVVNIQRIWKGYFLRKKLQYAGLGVLKRSVCQNDEELISLESKEKQDPLDYFSFEENGKIWWFSISTLVRIVFETMNPLNPYTRQPISVETRRRLRDVCRMRNIKIQNTRSSSIWLHVCQILEENGFESVNPILFQSLSRPQFMTFLILLKNDIEALQSESPKNLYYQTILEVTKHVLRKYTPFSGQVDASTKTAILLYNCLRKIPNPYPVCFAIMSAYTRL